MLFPKYRPRRMRRSGAFRRMIRETVLSVDDLVLPLFVVDGLRVRNKILSMPGQYQLSIDNLVKVAQEAYSVGIPAVMLFGIPSAKDSSGSTAYSRDGVVQRAISSIKSKVPNLVVISDVCLCQYIDHGHCGVVDGGVVNNDMTLELIAKIALSHALAGADMVAPSDMMDGRVLKIRNILDENNLSHIPIMSYAVKYCSQFYGPFRDAADSSPKYGDRSTYQMDPPNSIEAIREVTMDVAEGADIVMVKPALSYLDIIFRVKQSVILPVAAYNVSGEYSMIKAADKQGWINGKEVMMEFLTSIKRAGADVIVSYFALEAAKKINS